jgi:hypothetical protein
MSSQSDVELELSRLKGEIGAGKDPDAIEGGQPAADPAATQAAPAAAPDAEGQK